MTQKFNTFCSKATLKTSQKSYTYFSLTEAAKKLGDMTNLPKSLKVLLENLLRHEDNETVSAKDIEALATWLEHRTSDQEIQYRPARVLMQDFTGVPAVVDLAAMRAAMLKAGGDPQKINPLSAVDLVIDHSVMVDKFGTQDAFTQNVVIEMARNNERYEFLRWGQKAFDNFRVVPPGTGICHQVNLEYLGQAVWTEEKDQETYAFPDTLVGTDSHTTMINGLGVLGWGVGGIEAEAAMLGQPVSMLIPEVVGFQLLGKLKEGVTATDLVLTVVKMLRDKGVVGKFVEFFGDGLADLPLADRATIANMAPEYGATCGFFPIDDITLNYMRLTGRDAERIELVEAYAKAQGLWREAGDTPVFTDTLVLDMSEVRASIAGPKRPQDKVLLEDSRAAFASFMQGSADVTQKQAVTLLEEGGGGAGVDAQLSFDKTPTGSLKERALQDGDVVIAAITSCTNTSNPSVMLAAGLLAQKALARGLQRKDWVKSSLAPGSKVVTDYLAKTGLAASLDALGFNLVGYGCTTCIGNSGPLMDVVEHDIEKNNITVAAVLSGNRNFEGRIHPLVKTNWLASPPLVVAFALAGNITMDLVNEPLGQDLDGKDVYLKDIWPSQAEVEAAVAKVSTDMFKKEYSAVFDGDAAWQDIAVVDSETYDWKDDSTYIQLPPFFETITEAPAKVTDIHGMKALAILGDSVTTDHISPAGNIKADSPAGVYLRSRGVKSIEFNSYGSRRGNHEVMMRGTFANIRIKNEMLEGIEGGLTRYIPSGETMSIFDAAMKYQQDKTPLMVIAGKEYGSGSSRDWAAKGTNLLGVKAVLTESFERIHRSNLVGMGVLPLQFKHGDTRKSLNLTGSETFSLTGLSDNIKPMQDVMLEITYPSGEKKEVAVLCRIDTLNEVDYFKAGGILHYVLRKLIANKS